LHAAGSDVLKRQDGSDPPAGGSEPSMDLPDAAPSVDPPDSLADLVEGEYLGDSAPVPPTGRRAARAAAVQALYESDLTGHPASDTARYLARAAGLRAPLIRLAASLAERAESGRIRFDERIQQAAPAFPADQIAAVDRNVLRAALAEFEMSDEPLESVIVSEAIEIARLYGAAGAPAFIHGVLSAILGSSKA